MSTEQPRPPYQFIERDGYTTVKLNGFLTPEIAKAFDADVPEIIEKEPSRHVVVNCDNLNELSKPWVRSLLMLIREVQKVGREVRFIMVPSGIAKFFAAEGIDRVVKVCANLRDALVDVKLVTKKALDTDFINPFLDSTLHVLKVQANTEARAGKLFIKTAKDKFSGDISGVIGIVSASFNGSVVISFPEMTYLMLMSRMLGESCVQLTKDIEDGAGELTNIIFGKAKVILNEKGYGINTALPSVVTGKAHSVQTLTKGPVVVIPFESDVGPFFIEVCLSG